MHVLSLAVTLAPRDEGDLRMHLEARKSVHDLTARAFERASPVHVVLFVETRLQFHEREHALPRACRREQRLHDW